MNKESLWIIGVLIIVVGSFLISLFLLGSEKIHFMSDLIPYTVGFFITGLIASIFGFLFTIICLDRCEEAEIKQDNTTKIRVVLIAVTILHLILIGYLMVINYEWTVQALIIGSFGLYGTFTITSYSALFTTLLSFGIFVLPFVIKELGILDGYPDGQPDDLEMEGQTIQDAEKSFDRFIAFTKRQFGPLKKIKNYTLPLGITLTILGSFFIGLPQFFLIDSPLTWDPETETWFIKDYKGFIRGQLLLIGLLFLVIGLILIIQYIRRRPNSTERKLKHFNLKAGPKVS